MPLNKQNVSLPLSMGIDTKTDDKQQPAGTLNVLENAVFDEPGKLKKRNGYDKVDLKDTTGASIVGSAALAVYKEELNLFSATNMYSYASSVDQWSDKGAAFTIVPDSTQILRNNVPQTAIDSVHVEGLDVFVYEDSTGVSLSVMDNTSKAFLINNQLMSATGSNPKVVNRNGTVHIFYMDTATLKYRKFNIFDFTNIDAEATVVTAQDAIYDAVLIDDRIQIGYNSTTSSGTLAFISLKVDNTLGSALEVAGEYGSVAISVDRDALSRLICSYYDGSDIKFVALSYSLGAVLVAATSIETIANVTNTTVVEHSSDAYTVLYETSAAASYNHLVKSNTITAAASVGTASVLKRGVGLASKAWSHNSIEYVTLIHDNTLQSTLFVSDLSGNIVSKISPNTAGDVISAGGLPRVSSIDANNYLVASQIKGRLSQDNGVFFSILGVNSTVLDFEPASKYDTVSLGQNLHISGGYLKMYDGTQIVEHGFHLFPEGLAAGSTSTSGGVLSDGSYGYKAVYAWTDAQGVVHRSAPSLALTVVLSGGGSTQQQAITVPTLRLTDKSNVIVELYRTEASGTIYYLVSSTTAPTANDTTSDTVSIDDDTITDAALISRETLYTTGDALDNLPAPSCSIVESFKNRVFTTTSESNKLSYSKIRFEGYPVEFNDSLEQVIPSKGGDNISLKAMDDKLIILKENALYFLSGDGPNNLGEQDTFIEPELISSEIGCNNTDSVVLTPLGLLFKSNNGIYALTRSLSLQYIGAPVEDFNDLTITSSVVVADKNQVRFTTSDGETLVYNYFQQKWTTFSNHKALSAVSLQNDYYYLRPDNLLYKENENFGDNGSPIKMKVESGWLSFSGLQGFQRVYRMLLLGDFKSAHKLRIRVSYDYQDAYVQEQIIDTADFIDSSTYGSGATYGSESTFGSNNLYQIRLDFARQKCQSIKITIEDIQASHGEGLELSNALFVVGVKASEGKINEANGYGTA